jgi:ferric-dicitrate binding protein FerR (iron transport regulator)
LGGNDVVRRGEWEQYQRDMERRVSSLEADIKALRTEHDEDMENWEKEQRERRRWTVGQIVAVAGAAIALAALWLQALSLHH